MTAELLKRRTARTAQGPDGAQPERRRAHTTQGPNDAGPNDAGPERRKTQTTTTRVALAVWVLRRLGPAPSGPCVVWALRSLAVRSLAVRC